jgi:hypothetical protein
LPWEPVHGDQRVLEARTDETVTGEGGRLSPELLPRSELPGAAVEEYRTSPAGRPIRRKEQVEKPGLAEPPGVGHPNLERHA